MIVLYHSPQSRSIVAHWMLEEVGTPYRLHLLDLHKGEQKRPEFLAINPMGKVPAIDHDGVVVTEAAAICAYLADAFPEAGLAPQPGDPRRGAYFRWLFFGPGSLEPAILDRMFPRPAAVPAMALGYGTVDAPLDAIAAAVKTGPYLLGDLFSAADVVVGSGLQWAMMAGAVPQRADLAAYLTRLRDRPALQRVFAKDAELVAARQGR